MEWQTVVIYSERFCLFTGSTVLIQRKIENSWFSFSALVWRRIPLMALYALSRNILVLWVWLWSMLSRLGLYALLRNIFVLRVCWSSKFNKLEDDDNKDSPSRSHQLCIVKAYTYWVHGNWGHIHITTDLSIPICCPNTLLAACRVVSVANILYFWPLSKPREGRSRLSWLVKRLPRFPVSIRSRLGLILVASHALPTKPTYPIEIDTMTNELDGSMSGTVR